MMKRGNGEINIETYRRNLNVIDYILSDDNGLLLPLVLVYFFLACVPLPHNAGQKKTHTNVKVVFI